MKILLTIRNVKKKTVKLPLNKVSESNSEHDKFLRTKGKLNQASRFLPKRGCSLSLTLPPILSARHSNTVNHAVKFTEEDSCGKSLSLFKKEKKSEKKSE